MTYGPDQTDQGFCGPQLLKVIILKTSFSVVFYCILADEKHPDWFFGEFVNHIRYVNRVAGYFRAPSYLLDRHS